MSGGPPHATTGEMAFSDYGLFLREFRRTFHTTGAVLPSSPRLARALARFVPASSDAEPRSDAVQRSARRTIPRRGGGFSKWAPAPAR